MVLVRAGDRSSRRGFLKLAPDERGEGLRAERQRVLDRGRGDDAAVGDLEPRLPWAELDIGSPYRPDQDQAASTTASN
jgi:hypothetical protein